MSDVEAKKKKITKPTYTGFVAAALTRIFDISLQGDIFDWYKAVQHFKLLSPTEVKDEINDEFEMVNNLLAKTINSSQTGVYYTTQVLQNRRAIQLLTIYTPKLTDLLVRTLDKHGYLKDEFQRIRLRSLKDSLEMKDEEEEEEE